VPADAPDQATEQLANLHTRRRLAGTQNHRNWSTRRRIGRQSLIGLSSQGF
jgi:hypothetical protein